MYYYTFVCCSFPSTKTIAVLRGGIVSTTHPNHCAPSEISKYDNTKKKSRSQEFIEKVERRKEIYLKARFDSDTTIYNRTIYLSKHENENGKRDARRPRRKTEIIFIF